MSRPVDPELVREIAERIDDGRRVHLRNLSRELNVAHKDLQAAYKVLARQRGSDPLLDRARRPLDHAERRRSRPRRGGVPGQINWRGVRYAHQAQVDSLADSTDGIIDRITDLEATLESATASRTSTRTAYCVCRLHTSRPADPQLVREIAERIDDGRRVNLRLMARDLDIDFMELYEAYRELARRRGHDPLLDRARRRLDDAERLRSRPR